MCAKILLVDDEPIALETTKSMLVLNDHDVSSCQNSTDAISLLTGADFELILLDISMPNIDGFDFVKLMHSLQIKVPVIFVSSMDDDFTKKMATSEGVVRLVSKKKDFAQLPEIIKEVLAG